ncbi:MAG: HipA domain-containing protein [Actinomycetota bacterium]|nr:HipA domain-containing protein [Actinomycetota bacterium]
MSRPDQPTTAFVWVWLPGEADPVVAGRLDASGDRVDFTYGRSYLARSDAIALYRPELPLRPGTQRPVDGLHIAGCINDAGPDAWGQRIILHRRTGAAGPVADTTELGALTYLLESGSDRIGALDFQADPERYVARTSGGTLEEMVEAADRLEAGEPLSTDLDEALLHGTSVGGARPKVLLTDGDRRLIAKLSSSRDPYPVVKAEGVAMELARRVGLDVAATEVTTCLDHDVLLVERFDRPGGDRRRLLVSALTILRLDELFARYATYHELADQVRAGFTEPDATLRELFARITFNICVSNTDDHARNHAAFWDGELLTLTPAYDLCPQLRAGNVTAQAMAYGPGDARASRLADLVDHAGIYHLTAAQAREIVDHQLDVIRSSWDDAADRARLTSAERAALWGRQVLNPFALEGYEAG